MNMMDRNKKPPSKKDFSDIIDKNSKKKGKVIMPCLIYAFLFRKLY